MNSGLGFFFIWGVMVLVSIGGAVLWIVIGLRAVRAHEAIASSLRDIARSQRPPPRRTGGSLAPSGPAETARASAPPRTRRRRT